MNGEVLSHGVTVEEPRLIADAIVSRRFRIESIADDHAVNVLSDGELEIMITDTPAQPCQLPRGRPPSSDGVPT